MSPPAQLEVSRTTVEGGCRLRLHGTIDEHFDRRLLTAHASPVMVIDLDGVKRITSFGVREWVGALRELAGRFYAFVNCRPAIVSQFNMVANFAGSGHLVSLYAPHVCPACNAELDVLVDLRRQYAQVIAGQLPRASCPKCGDDVEFDDLPESYFSYAAAHPSVSLPRTVERLIDGDASDAQERFRVRKEVCDQVTALWLYGPIDQRVRFKRLAEGLEGELLVLTAGVSALSPTGVERLADLFALPGTRPYLARARPEIVAALHGSAAAMVAGALVSALVPARCPACDRDVTIELGAGALRGPGSMQAADPVCPRCGGPVALLGEGIWGPAARALAAVEVPLDIAAYLGNRPGDGPPERESAFADHDSAGSTRLVLDRYEVVERIGRGGMAEVFVARQRGPEGFAKTVVLKRILPDLSADPVFTELFLQEARVAACISHSNVVQIFDLGHDGDRYFMAMEYVRGWDLHSVLRIAASRSRPLPIELACRIVADVCAGLHAAHTCTNGRGENLRIVHRDVSPHNVLISVEGAVKIADFGIAKAADSLHHTDAGTVRGKLSYMAPEQLDPAFGGLGPPADIFAAGVILYECVAGRHPFKRRSTQESMHLLLFGPEADLGAAAPEVPAGVVAVANRALAREAAARFASAAEMQLELERQILALGRPGTTAQLAAWLAEVSAPASVASAAVSGDASPVASGVNLTCDAATMVTPSPTRLSAGPGVAQDVHDARAEGDVAQAAAEQKLAQRTPGRGR